MPCKSQSSNGIQELSSKICNDELIALLPLDEQSCEDHIFFYIVTCRNVIYNSNSNKEVV